MPDIFVFPQDKAIKSGSGKMVRAGGMTLRDYFADSAMTVLLEHTGLELKEIAKAAYRMADTMLSERDRRG
jgi:hypothetical protein